MLHGVTLHSGSKSCHQFWCQFCQPSQQEDLENPVINVQSTNSNRAGYRNLWNFRVGAFVAFGVCLSPPSSGAFSSPFTLTAAKSWADSTSAPHRRKAAKGTRQKVSPAVPPHRESAGTGTWRGQGPGLGAPDSPNQMSKVDQLSIVTKPVEHDMTGLSISELA